MFVVATGLGSTGSRWGKDDELPHCIVGVEESTRHCPRIGGSQETGMKAADN